MKSKRLFYWGSFFTLTLMVLSFAPRALAFEEQVELELDSVFAPAQGYDDNDNVTASLRGVLPNACYSLGDASAQLQNDGKSILIKQSAVRFMDGLCSSPEIMPLFMKLPVPFTNEVTLGALKSGKYKLKYHSKNYALKNRDLEVTDAASPTVDSAPYASLNSILTSDIVAEGSNITVSMTGLLTSTCMDLDEIKVTPVKDAFVILPLLKFNPNAKCESRNDAFQRTISLGTPASGTYLVHARSANGAGFSHIIQVGTVQR